MLIMDEWIDQLCVTEANVKGLGRIDSCAHLAQIYE